MNNYLLFFIVLSNIFTLHGVAYHISCDDSYYSTKYYNMLHNIRLINPTTITYSIESIVNRKKLTIFEQKLPHYHKIIHVLLIPWEEHIEERKIFMQIFTVTKGNRGITVNLWEMRPSKGYENDNHNEFICVRIHVIPLYCLIENYRIENVVQTFMTSSFLHVLVTNSDYSATIFSFLYGLTRPPVSTTMSNFWQRYLMPSRFSPWVIEKREGAIQTLVANQLKSTSLVTVMYVPQQYVKPLVRYIDVNKNGVCAILYEEEDKKCVYIQRENDGKGCEFSCPRGAISVKCFHSYVKIMGKNGFPLSTKNIDNLISEFQICLPDISQKKNDYFKNIQALWNRMEADFLQQENNVSPLLEKGSYIRLIALLNVLPCNTQEDKIGIIRIFLHTIIFSDHHT